ncbi:hypothetical protein D6D85_11115 [Candidatus Methanodesulfokora washburnensis]|jgi:hypothetical protein|uniref:Uncharacterized protein n=2 Tax=Candidatus Methanodesulfokora washburnensis TaxID=2478471 RepID=A0A429GH34_9CREN|nr:hypothetical protein D6D85_11115 [Candidatus Methanodesulfokores washburnensis]
MAHYSSTWDQGDKLSEDSFINHLACAFTKSDILELFETLRAQMPVAEDLIKEEYRNMRFLWRAGLERIRMEV